MSNKKQTLFRLWHVMPFTSGLSAWFFTHPFEQPSVNIALGVFFCSWTALIGARQMYFSSEGIC